MNDGSPRSSDQTNCDPLPCSYSYSFPQAVAPSSVRMAHADSPGRFPSRITVSYHDGRKWKALESLSTSDPGFQKLYEWKLSDEGCTTLRNIVQPPVIGVGKLPCSSIAPSSSHPFKCIEGVKKGQPAWLNRAYAFTGAPGKLLDGGWTYNQVNMDGSRPCSKKVASRAP